MSGPEDISANIPRPPNSWILYRADRLKELPPTVEKRTSESQAKESKIIAQMWEDAPQDVRDFYEQLAKQKKAEHQAQYPDYVFQPKSKAEKQRLKAQREEQNKLQRQLRKNASRRVSRVEDSLPLNPAPRQVPVAQRKLTPSMLCGKKYIFKVDPQPPASEMFPNHPLYHPEYARRVSVVRESNPDSCNSKDAGSVPHLTPLKSNTSRNRMSIASLLNSPDPSDTADNRYCNSTSTEQSRDNQELSERLPTLHNVSGWDISPLDNARNNSLIPDEPAQTTCDTVALAVNDSPQLSTQLDIAGRDTLPSIGNNSDYDSSDSEDAGYVSDMLLRTESDWGHYPSCSDYNPLSDSAGPDDSATDYDSAWEVTSVSSCEHERRSYEPPYFYDDDSQLSDVDDSEMMNPFMRNSVDPYEGDVDDVDPRDRKM